VHPNIVTAMRSTGLLAVPWLPIIPPLIPPIRDALKTFAVFVQNFQKRPLKGFKKGKTYVVCSSLYPMTYKKRGKSIVVPVVKRMNRKPTAISPPSPLTGVMDAIALAQIGGWLADQKIDFGLRIDETISDEEKKENLILLGSPTSNTLTEDVTDGIPANKFAFTKSYTLQAEGVNYDGGDYGVAIRVANPFNRNRPALSLAGVGPIGTAAAADFCIRKFETASKDVRSSNCWLVIIRGILKKGLEIESHICYQTPL